MRPRALRPRPGADGAVARRPVRRLSRPVLPWVALSCCVVPLALAAVGYGWWRWTNRGDRPLRARAAELGIGPGLLPSVRERTLHLPRDEADLRARCPGGDVERIVQLYRHGELARAVVLELGSTERPVDAVTRHVELWQRYGWYDAAGQLHLRRSDEPGLLNRELLPKGPMETFLVAFDRNSRDHVVFFGAGLPPPVDAPPALAPRPGAGAAAGRWVRQRGFCGRFTCAKYEPAHELLHDSQSR